LRRVTSLVGLAALATILAIAMLPAARATSGFQFTVAGSESFSGMPVVLPCVGESGTVSASGNGVFHVNVNNAGDGWVTFTFAGKFTFVPDSPGTVGFSGTVTVWDGANFNLNNFAGTMILEIQATGTDGSTLSAHLLMSVTFSPSGTMTASPVNVVC
jgi:hypothetical protein